VRVWTQSAQRPAEINKNTTTQLRRCMSASEENEFNVKPGFQFKHTNAPQFLANKEGIYDYLLCDVSKQQVARLGSVLIWICLS
jgi:hypothetical protein